MNQTQHKIIIELNIGSVAAGVLETRDGNYSLIKVEKRVVPLPEKLSLKEIWRKARQPLFSFLQELLKSFKRSDILIGLNLPFYSAQTRIIRIKRKNQFLIDKKFIDDLLKEELDIFERENVSRGGAQANEFEILEKEIMHSLLNGYPVKKFLGKNVFEAELSLYLSTGFKKINDEIREEVEKTRPGLNLSFRTLPLIVYKGLSFMAKSRENFLFMGLGEELSEILLVSEGHIKEILSFAKGFNVFARRVAFRFNVPLEEGSDLLSNYLQGKLNPEYEQKIEEIISVSFEEFEMDLKETFTTLGKEYFLPYNVMVSAPPFLFPKIKEILSREMFKNYTVLRKSFEPELLELKFVENLLRMETGPAMKIKNNFELALLALYSKNQI